MEFAKTILLTIILALIVAFFLAVFAPHQYKVIHNWKPLNMTGENLSTQYLSTSLFPLFGLDGTFFYPETTNSPVSCIERAGEQKSRFNYSTQDTTSYKVLFNQSQTLSKYETDEEYLFQVGDPNPIIIAPNSTLLCPNLLNNSR